MSRTRWPLVLTTFSLIVLLCSFLPAASASASASSSAQSPDTELICHPSDPKDCYPRVFQPTDEFQPIRQDQEIPLGLHVRLNIWTGQKEAKINVPGEIDPVLEGSPVDHGIVVVEPEAGEAEDSPQIPSGAPEYDPAGKVKGPQIEAKSFLEAMTMLQTGVTAGEKSFDALLDDLEELSHDIYYGLKISENQDAVKSLFCLMADQGTPAVDGSIPSDQQAASILAGSLQNNPTALKEVAKNWKVIMQHPCPKDGTPLRQCLFKSLSPGETSSDKAQSAKKAAKLKAKISAVNSLIKDKSIRDEFLDNGGMSQLLQILLPEGPEWAGAQRKVGQLALDNFLDEDMGAVLGQWPRAAKLSDKQCESTASRVDEGCWDYHVARVMKNNKADKSHWSKDLHKRLATARKSAPSKKKHDEL